MKCLIVAFVMTAGLPAFAQSSNHEKSAQMAICSFRGNTYRVAADYRDGGHSPQVTYGMMLGFTRESAKHGLTSDALKQIINQVYFDPGFIHAHGLRLHSQILHACLENDAPGFTPLK